ncbi:hypothetical protein J3Q64DRAFT_1767938 [Phycomyces blakesleeanus]|uniref:Uncharacterized protein n=1 Tax=Phycomyces blakesleeanus TaxID=4837 RepID=A0ABR3ANE6_PHYBL
MNKKKEPVFLGHHYFLTCHCLFYCHGVDPFPFYFSILSLLIYNSKDVLRLIESSFFFFFFLLFIIISSFTSSLS